MYTVVGIEKIEYLNKVTNKDVKGTRIYLRNDDKTIEDGYAFESEYVPGFVVNPYIPCVGEVVTSFLYEKHFNSYICLGAK